MGITRVILAMKQAGLAEIAPARPRLYIASLGDTAVPTALSITERLRREGVYVECDVVGRSLKAQMKYANKLGADYTLILGDSEIESGAAQLRNMKTSTQEEVTLSTFSLPED
jgi:histidyl-tRNA synthetase